MKPHHIFLPAILLLSITLPACTPGNLRVEDAWARPGSTGGNTAVYFTIDNSTREDDVLLGVASSAAHASEMHKTMMVESEESQSEAGMVMQMQPQTSVEIRADGYVEFKPGGLHVMLTDLVDDLEVGETLTVILTFENAGEISVEVTVEER